MVHIMKFTPFRSPITGELISDRAQLREHEKKHNVVQVGNDFATEMQKNRDAVVEYKENQSNQKKEE